MCYVSMGDMLCCMLCLIYYYCYYYYLSSLLPAPAQDPWPCMESQECQQVPGPRERWEERWEER